MNDAPLFPLEGTHEAAARRIERLISNLLRAGVLTSLAIVALGTVVSFVHHPEYCSSPQAFQELINGTPDYPYRLGSILAGVGRFSGQALVALGLLVLIATPVLRVAVSIFAFAAEKDRTYVVITSIVLALLVASFLIGAVA
ncbi:DUF1634 domain-containing protein [bacterium]|nr:DUF1634 domain-containing protein [bacterium]